MKQFQSSSRVIHLLVVACALVGSIVWLPSAAQAQIDTDFWLAVPEVTDQHGDQPIYIRLVSYTQPTVVKISMPARPSFVPISVTLAANSTQSVNLTAFKGLLENAPANAVLDKGLRIVATNPVSAYYEVANDLNPAIFPLKGKNALGTRFYVVAQNVFANQLGSAAADIVATEDGTMVTVRLTADVVGHLSGTTFTVQLDKGETFSLRATNTSAASHLGGTLIVANKPVAVTVSDDSIYNGGAYDLTGDQLVPVNVIGTEYIAVKGFGTTERVFVVATQDTTSIFVNGSSTPSAVLQEGQLASFSISGISLYLEATHPVYALHLSGHQAETGDALLPPIACTGSDTIGFVRSSAGSFSLMVLTEAPHVGDFLVNNNANTLKASDFSAVPGTNGNWMAARLDLTASLPTGANRIVNTSGLFHLGILNALGLSSEYGYFSNFSSLNLGSDATICEGDTLQLDGGKKGTYLWHNGSTKRYFNATQAGEYWVQTTVFGCTLTDTIVVAVNKLTLNLGSDTSICHYDQIGWNTAQPNVTYLWQDGNTQPTMTAADSGVYFVTLTDTLGCQKSDTVQVGYNPIAELGSDTAFVCDSLFYTLSTGVLSGTYVWQDGSTSPTFFVTTPDEYFVTVIDADGCTSSDTVEIRFVTSPDTDLGDDILLCEGDSLVLDALIDLESQYLWQNGATDRFFTVTQPGVYTVLATDIHRCTNRDTVLVDYFLAESISLGADTVLCEGTFWQLIPNYQQGASYLWQDSSAGKSYLVGSAGTYSVAITNEYGCTVSDTVTIGYQLKPITTLPFDTVVCLQTVLVLNAAQPDALRYEWTGFSSYYGQNSYKDATFAIVRGGVYTVAVTNRCGTNTQLVVVEYEDCDCSPFVPNAFTPNGDGNNDKLWVSAGCEIAEADLQIFDRWGNLVFQTADLAEGWDGASRTNAQTVTNGVYIWKLTYTAANSAGNLVERVMAGDVTVLR